MVRNHRLDLLIAALITNDSMIYWTLTLSSFELFMKNHFEGVLIRLLKSWHEWSDLNTSPFQMGHLLTWYSNWNGNFNKIFSILNSSTQRSHAIAKKIFSVKARELVKLNNVYIDFKSSLLMVPPIFIKAVTTPMLSFLFIYSFWTQTESYIHETSFSSHSNFIFVQILCVFFKSRPPLQYWCTSTCHCE